MNRRDAKMQSRKEKKGEKMKMKKGEVEPNRIRLTQHPVTSNQ